MSSCTCLRFTFSSTPSWENTHRRHYDCCPLFWNKVLTFIPEAPAAGGPEGEKRVLRTRGTLGKMGTLLLLGTPTILNSYLECQLVATDGADWLRWQTDWLTYWLTDCHRRVCITWRDVYFIGHWLKFPSNFSRREVFHWRKLYCQQTDFSGDHMYKYLLKHERKCTVRWQRSGFFQCLTACSDCADWLTDWLNDWLTSLTFTWFRPVSSVTSTVSVLRWRGMTPPWVARSTGLCRYSSDDQHKSKQNNSIF